MAPYAEAGERALLFGGNVEIYECRGSVVVEAKKSVLPELLTLRKREDPLSIQSDTLGIVYKNGDPTSNPVCIPKSAVFVITGTLDFIVDKPI